MKSKTEGKKTTFLQNNYVSPSYLWSLHPCIQLTMDQKYLREGDSVVAEKAKLLPATLAPRIGTLV